MRRGQPMAPAAHEHDDRRREGEQRRERDQARHERLVPVGERARRGAQGAVVVIVVATGAHRRHGARGRCPPRRSCPSCPSSSSTASCRCRSSLLDRCRSRRPTRLPPVIWSSAWSSASRSWSSSGWALFFFLLLARWRSAVDGMYWSAPGESLWAWAAGAADGDERGDRGKRAQRRYRVKRVTSQTLPRQTRRGPPAGLSARLQWAFGHRSSCPRARSPPPFRTAPTRFRHGGFWPWPCGGRWSPACCCGCFRGRRCPGEAIVAGALPRRRSPGSPRSRWAGGWTTAEPSTTRCGRSCYAGVFALVVVASPARSARSWLAGLAIGLVALSVLALGSRMIPSLFPTQDLVRGPARDARAAELPARLLERPRRGARPRRACCWWRLAGLARSVSGPDARHRGHAAAGARRLPHVLARRRGGRGGGPRDPASCSVPSASGS